MLLMMNPSAGRGSLRRAKEVLVNNRHVLDQLAQRLVEKETVTPRSYKSCWQRREDALA